MIPGAGSRLNSDPFQADKTYMGGSRRFRRAVGAAALVAVTALSAAGSATATDINALRDRAQAVADEISGMETRLSRLADEQVDIEADIMSSDHELSALEVEIHEADMAYEDALERFEERAVEAYKGGAAAEMSMLLSARDLNDMYDLSEMLSAAAVIDQRTIDDLLAAKEKAETLQNDIDDRKQRLMAARTRAARVAEEIESTVAERNDVFVQLRDEVAELQRQARIEAREEAEVEAEDVAPPVPGLPDVPGTPQNPTWGTHDPDRLVGTGPSSGVPAMFESTGVTFEGEASWYGPGFEGNTTANGDIFDSRLYTVASRTLPFGTYLYVHYGGRGVVVYVNDRGPYAGDRILDLSHAAAQAIGISGVGWVRAEIILKK
jgi:rare lipoprotein A